MVRIIILSSKLIKFPLCHSTILQQFLNFSILYDFNSIYNIKNLLNIFSQVNF